MESRTVEHCTALPALVIVRSHLGRTTAGPELAIRKEHNLAIQRASQNGQFFGFFRNTSQISHENLLHALLMMSYALVGDHKMHLASS